MKTIVSPSMSIRKRLCHRALVLSCLLTINIQAGSLEELSDALFTFGFTSEAPARIADSLFSADAILYDHGAPSDYEQLMLELLNRARANPGAEAVRLGIDLNEGLAAGSIEDAPKQPLASHPALLAAARAHSQWMLDTDTFSHTGVDGSDPGERMEDAGYVFSGSWAWGENISWGGTTGTPDVEAYTIARHERLFLSPGHRENICNATFDEVGLGVLEGVYTSSTSYNAVMATQKFSKSGSTPGPLLLGVVFSDANGDGLYSPGEGLPGVTVSIEGAAYYAVTSSSGGYAFPYPEGSGSVQLCFSGAALPLTVYRSVERSGQNIKQDLEASSLRLLELETIATGQAADTGFTSLVSGTPGTEFRLLHSLDLKDWQLVQVYTLVEDSLSISHQPADANGPQFYRIEWVP